MRKVCSVVLATASSGGTIAAVRHLGANGFKVEVVASHRLAAAAWSRYAAQIHSGPPETEGEQFLERLLAIGARDPGKILLPTSDETAWLYALNAAELGRYFRPGSAFDRRFAKDTRQEDFLRMLQHAQGSCGCCLSWHIRTVGEIANLAPTLPYPVLIKPRTHVHRLRNDKGVVVRSASELIDQYQRFVDREKARAGDDPLLRDANLPILQQFVNVKTEGVHSVTGYIDRTGELFVTRSATKVFQRSQPVGVGVCFESRATSAMLASAVRRLCQSIGYFGIFEVEFLSFNGEWAAIDFNPRLFSQIGLDIRRGAALPLFACLEAAGETDALHEAVTRAQAEDGEEVAFFDRFTLRSILLAQTLTGRISLEDRAYWRSWITKHAARAVDFSADSGDPIPGIVHALSEIYLGLRSVPRFLRSTPRSSKTKRIAAKELS